MSDPVCSDTTAPNGIATMAVGRIVTLAMNQACSMNSRNWNGRLNVFRATSTKSSTMFPACVSAPLTGRKTELRVTPIRYAYPCP